MSDKFISGDYDVELPGEPQRTAALLAAGDDSEDDTNADDDVNEEADDDTDSDDSLDDDWLYGDAKDGGALS